MTDISISKTCLLVDGGGYPDDEKCNDEFAKWIQKQVPSRIKAASCPAPTVAVKGGGQYSSDRIYLVQTCTGEMTSAYAAKLNIQIPTPRVNASDVTVPSADKAPQTTNTVNKNPQTPLASFSTFLSDTGTEDGAGVFDIDGDGVGENIKLTVNQIDGQKIEVSNRIVFSRNHGVQNNRQFIAIAALKDVADISQNAKISGIELETEKRESGPGDVEAGGHVVYTGAIKLNFIDGEEKKSISMGQLAGLKGAHMVATE